MMGISATAALVTLFPIPTHTASPALARQLKRKYLFLFVIIINIQSSLINFHEYFKVQDVFNFYQNRAIFRKKCNLKLFKISCNLDFIWDIKTQSSFYFIYYNYFTVTQIHKIYRLIVRIYCFRKGEFPIS